MQNKDHFSIVRHCEDQWATFQICETWFSREHRQLNEKIRVLRNSKSF